jgi:D-3-phosphoglycerate dehydrogenase
MTDGAVRQITVECGGELADLDTQPLSAYVLKGVLSHHLGAEQVNIVNAIHLAQQRDIQLVFQKSLFAQGSSNEITLRLKTTEEERWVTGSAVHGIGERLIKIGPYPVDIAPEGHLLLISQMDKPGIIGQVGAVFGANDINIASMQVGRQEIGGSAVMILKNDKKASETVIKELYDIPDIKRIREITLD